MKKLELQIGDKYNYWTILSLSDFVSKKGERYYKCQCDCGNIKQVAISNLKRGNTVSCGCHNKDRMKNNNPGGKKSQDA